MSADPAMTSPAQPTVLAASLPPGWTLAAFNTVDSTNAVARTLAEEGAAAGTVVWALRQEAGRGRWRRHWESPEGNLYCSAVLRPTVAAAMAGQLAFVAALALADAVEELAPGLELGLKWPNDVLANRRKISGILLESSVTSGGALPWVVLGTGLNLVSHPDGTPYPATDLKAESGREVRPAAALEAYVAALDDWLARWLRDGFNAVRHAWLDRAVGMGGPLVVRLHSEALSGRFHGLDGGGALVLETADGERHLVSAGDVFFGDADAADH